MSQKIFLLTFKGICMNFLLELNFFILSHPVTSKQPHKVVQILMGHPVQFAYNRLAECVLFAPLLLQRLESAALPCGHEPI